MEKQDTPTQANPEKPTTSRWTHPRRRIGKMAVPLFLAAIAILTTYNSLAIYAASTPTYPFAGTSTFQIAAQYSFGANPSGSVLLPGDVVSFSLTVQDNGHSNSQLLLFFNSTNPNEWTTQTLPSCGASFCGVTPGSFSMTVTGSTNPIAPINNPQGGNVFDNILVTLTPGRNTITGQISAANTASVGDSFSLNWFGTPQ